jgi:hypothetical protein
MRTLLLLVLASTASSADAAVIEFDDRSSPERRGRLWIHLQGTRRDPQSGRRLSRVIRFGPLAEGKRRRLRVLIRGRVPRRGYVYASAITRQNDGLKTRTVTRNVIRYLPS